MDKTKGKSTGRTILNVTGIILCIVLVPILIVNITIIVSSFVHPKDVPGFFGYKPFIVLSDSMNPVIYSGDIVIVKQTNTDRLVKGDIVAYKDGNSVILHRIVNIDESGADRQFTTQGDNNNAPDPMSVSESKIEGLYVYDIPKLGNGALFMQTPLGMILFIALPLILFVLYDLIRRRLAEKPAQSKEKDLQEELERMKKLVSELESKDNSEKEE